MNPQRSNESNGYTPSQQGGVVNDTTTVQSYASDVTQAYRLESLEEPLEVHTAQQPNAVSASPRQHFGYGGFFSRRKAMIVSTLITALVLLLTLSAMAFLVRRGPDDKKQSAQTAQQDVKIEGAVNSTVPQELQGAEQSLLVRGDLITRGSLKISDGGFVTIIRVQNPTANQTVTLPGTSGTLCLDSNNCGYASQETADALQGQLGALQSQIDDLNSIVESLGQVTIPPAGVTELNGQTGSVSLQGSVNRVIVNTSNGVVTVTTPQDLDANANVQFGSLTLSASGQIRANTLVQTGAGSGVTIDAGNDMITFVAGGRVFQLPAAGGATQTICTTGATCASGSGTAVILSPGTAQVDGTADSSIFINDTGGGNLVHLQSGGVDRFTISSTGSTTVGGSLTVSGLGNGFVRSTGGTLGVVTAINLASDVTGILPIANGGTGSNTASGARTNLGAAGSGANSDITSTTALNTITPSAALTIGTPSQQFTLQGASNSSISAGSGANITTLAFAAPSGANTITFPALTGTVCVSTGNCAAAGTAGGDLTGSYPNPTIARLQGANLNVTGSSNGQILIYNSANTRWENTSVSGDATISGLGVVTIANNAVTTGKIADGNVTAAKIADSNVTTAKIADGNVTNAKLQNSSLTVTSGNGLLNGGAVSLGSAITLNIGQGDGITVNADDIAVDNTVCRTTGNCAGVGGNGDVSGTGSNGRIALFNGAKTLTSSTLLQSAGALTLDSGNNFVLTSGNLMLSNGNVDVTGGGNFTGTVSGANAVQNDEFVTLAQLNAAIGGVGGGVDSLNTLAGDLSLQGTAGQITISSNGTDTLTLSLNSAVTLQGNTFNGVNQLVRLGASGELPVLDGSNLTNLNASNLASGTVPSGRLSGSYTGITGLGTVTTGTWNGNAIADTYVQDNITISNLGTVDWTALNNYPAACPAGQAITQLGDTITCAVFAAGSGSGNYIQNQNSSAQVANFWINGSGQANSLSASTLTSTVATGTAPLTVASTTLVANLNADYLDGQDGSYYLNIGNATGTLNTARIADGSIGNAKLTNSSLTVTAGGGLINGGSIALGGTATLNIGQGDGITVNADDIAVDNTVCRTNGTNCPVITGGSGGIGDITGNGTANRLAVFDAAKNIVNSYLLQSAGTLTLDNGVDLVLAGGDISVTGGGSFTGTVSGANATQNNEFVTLQQLNAAVGGVGGGVSSLNTLSGDLDLQGTAGQITVSDNGTDTITLALDANVTLQGNTFNGADELVQLTNTGILPVLDGSNLTNVNAALLQGQNGAYYLDLGNATGTLNIARIADGSITNVKLANSAVTVTAGNGLTDGGSVSLGGTTTLNIGAGSGITVNANDVAVDATVARLNANANFTASLQQGGNDVCTTAGNCAGVGGVGDISGTGSNGRIALFNGAKTLTSSTLLQSAGTLTLDTGNNLVLTAGNLTLSSGDISVTGNGTFSGTLTATSFTGSGANLTSLNATQLTSGTVASARISGSYTGITGVGTVTVGTWNGTAISDAYVQDNITISSAGTVDWAALNNYPAACPAGSAITQLGDTITCQAFATGGDGGVTTIGAIDSQTKSANGAVISGANLYLQTADASNPGLVSTGSQIFAGNKTFNGSVTIAANQSLTITGGTTANRPASPTEGMLYFDTDTKRLLVYSNGKWQADRATSTKIVGTSAVGGISGAVASQSYDGADYVNASTTSAQTIINTALTAAATTGGTVYLMEGTYIIDGSITIPNNVTLTGAGNGTTIKLKNSSGTTNMITNTDTTTGSGVTVSNLTIDGNNVNNGSGTIRGIYLSGMGGSARQGATIKGVAVNNVRQSGIYLTGSANTTISGNSLRYAANLVSEGGIVITGSSNNVTMSDNSITLNVSTTTYGIRVDSSATNLTITGNNIYSAASGSYLGIGIYFTAGGNNSTIADNTFTSSSNTAGMDTAIRLSGGTTRYVTVTGNAISNVREGINISAATNNIVSNNSLYDTGNTTANGAIVLDSSASNNTITGNTINDSSCTTTCYAIDIQTGTSNYVAGNNLGNGTINDAGTNTVFGGQTTTSTTGNYQIQPAGSATIELMKGTNVTGALNVTSNIDTNGSLTVGNANQFVVSNLGVVTSGTWQGTAVTDTYVANTLTVDSASTVDWQALSNYPAACPAGNAITALGDTITCSAFSTGGSGVSTIGAIDSQTKSANGAVIVGSTLYLQTADASNVGLVSTGAQTFAGNKTFNGSVVLAASQSLTITGGNTASRPSSPVEGMIYFDTTTKQLLTYANGKWQADRSTATKIVGTSASGGASSAVASAGYDSADYVNASTTSAQTVINSALTALSSTGGTVYLMEGTYIIDGSISIPNNVKLVGSGAGTVIKAKNGINTNFSAIVNTDTTTGTNVTIQDISLDGNKANQSGSNIGMAGIDLNGMGGGSGGSARAGAKINNVLSNNWYTNGTTSSCHVGAGICLSSSNNNTISNSSTQNNTAHGIYVSASSYNALSNNISQGNGSTGYMIYNGANNNVMSNNVADGNGGNGIAVTLSAANTLTGNTAQNNTNDGIFLFAGGNNTLTGNITRTNGLDGFLLSTNSNRNTLTGNTAQNNGTYGFNIVASSNNNVLSSNQIYDNGGAANNNGVFLDASDANSITDNKITDSSATTNNYAINISNATSDNNYVANNNLTDATLTTGSINNNGTGTTLSGNTLGSTGTIAGTGTGTIYGGQINSSTNYVIQPAGTVELMKNTNITGTLNITGDVDTNGSLTVGNANQFVISNTGVVTSGTWQGTAVADAYVADNITISSAGTVDWTALQSYPGACAAGSAVTQIADTLTCTAFATGTAGSYIQNQNASQQATSNFWISGTARSDVSVLTPTLDTATATALNIGTTNATQINLNKNVVVAASQSLTIVGGNTASRPASPTEGMVYFDTTTKQLLTYANGKWQADRSEAVIVAASNSSQNDKDAADYVANGNTAAAADGDQVEINQALTAGSGKKVVLLAGTYTVDASVSVPNDTTLAGVGNGTLITIPNSFNANISAIVNADTTTGAGVIIQDLRLDGNKTNQTSGSMIGIELEYMGTGTLQGARIMNVSSNNWRTSGIYGSETYNSIFSNNSLQGNSRDGIGLYESDNNTITGNVTQNNNLGIDIESGSSFNTITGNTSTNNGWGIQTYDNSNNTFTGNTIKSNANFGIDVDLSSVNNTISGNNFHDNGGATANNAIRMISGSTGNNVTGNVITDTSCTTTCHAIVIGSSVTNHISGNSLGSNGTISDGSSATTVYSGQINGSTNYMVQPAGTVELMKNTNVTGTLNVTGNFDTNGSLTVGNANQFVISNTGVVTSGTWQAGTIGLLYGGTNNTSYTTNGIVYSNGTSLVSTGAGTTGQCLIATTGSAPTWGTCTVASLQSVYNASSPATILMTDNKDFTINTGDTTTDSSIIFNLSCATCSANGGRFAVQDAGTDVFTVNPNGDILIGSSTNGVIFTNGFKLEARGSARNTKAIRLSAEYPSAVITPDLTNNLGTMTSDYDGTNRMNYYNWTTTQGTNQDYDIVVQVPLPSDFSAWASNPLSISTYTSDTTNGLITLEARDSSNTVICNYVGVTPGSTGTWATNNTACTLSTGTYTAGDYITLRIKLQAPNAGNTRVGNIVLNYLSKF